MTFDRRVFDHIGIPTDERHGNEVFVEATRVWVTSPRDHPANVEWLRYEPDSPVQGPLRTRPHVAYRTLDLDAAMAGHEVLLDPFEVGDGFARVGFVLVDGAPVEFMQYADPDETGWF
ncbi:MAG: hypothetical protein WD638_00600 [Nitriliruptoraceae bacterium]